MSRARKYFLGVTGFFAGAILSGYVAGCASAQGGGAQGIPNLRLVEAPSIYRSGQITSMAQWIYVRDVLQVSNVVKLNEINEAPDVLPPGMTLYYFPISIEEQLDPLLVGRVAWQILEAVRKIGPGTLVHCEYGNDRTGAAIYARRIQEGWSEEAARAELLADGFHPLLLGLERFTRSYTTP